jgi:hypothetical protein
VDRPDTDKESWSVTERVTTETPAPEFSGTLAERELDTKTGASSASSILMVTVDVVDKAAVIGATPLSVTVTLKV